MKGTNCNHGNEEIGMKAIISSIIVLIVLTVSAFGSPAATARESFEQYLSALKDGRFDDAENCWARTASASPMTIFRPSTTAPYRS